MSTGASEMYECRSLSGYYNGRVRIPVLRRAANRYRLSGPRARDFVVRERLKISDKEASGVLVADVLA